MESEIEKCEMLQMKKGGGKKTKPKKKKKKKQKEWNWPIRKESGLFEKKIQVSRLSPLLVILNLP